VVVHPFPCAAVSERLAGPTADASKVRKCYSLVSYVLTALHGPPDFNNVQRLSLLLARQNPVDSPSVAQNSSLKPLDLLCRSKDIFATSSNLICTFVHFVSCK